VNASSPVIVIVPARGGSKGIPDKNLRAVGGRSLVARTVTVATASPHVRQAIVTTDSERIAEEAARHGASVVMRPPELASDEASSESALLHALDAGPPADIVVFLQCTSPFLTPADLDRTIEAVTDGGADSAFTAVASHGFLWTPDEEGSYVGVNHDAAIRLRRQDRQPEYLETGAAYVMRVDGFRSARHRFFGRTVAVETDPRRAMEIDTPADLEIARALAPVLDAEAVPLDLPVPRLVALDFDGVFTDNRVHVDQDGRESVTCHRGDGHGLSQLKRHLPIVVLSTERNPVVAARCDKLGLPYEQGLGDTKLAALRRTADRMGIDLADVLFVGNDVNDLDCLREVGTAVSVADAVPEVRAVAHALLSRGGGDGALRELSEALIRAIQEVGHDVDSQGRGS
jgi:YrbI family 3-deoxy-D-manno-octulosonate 8-phosphate phosphatase